VTVTRKAPFRAGGTDLGLLTPAALDLVAATGNTYLADVSEFEPDVADAAYLAWSKAIVIRAAYGDAHDDKAWYGGARRAALHAGGAQFLGIYQYLVAGQGGAAQASALHSLVGALQPGEVLIPDFEEGQHAMLTAWYNQMTALYGAGIGKYLWTYSGLYFGQSQGVLPVQWLADYTSVEPSSPHTLWQFTSSFNVPGVGPADCSLYHGTVAQLAALAYQAPSSNWTFGPVRDLRLLGGKSTFLVSGQSPDAYVGTPPGAPGVVSYEVTCSAGPALSGALAGYPVFIAKDAASSAWSYEGHGLDKAGTYTVGVRACATAGSHSGPWVTGQVTVPGAS
jgi:hypothetical protein